MRHAGRDNAGLRVHPVLLAQALNTQPFGFRIGLGFEMAQYAVQYAAAEPLQDGGDEPNHRLFLPAHRPRRDDPKRDVDDVDPDSDVEQGFRVLDNARPFNRESVGRNLAGNQNKGYNNVDEY